MRTFDEVSFVTSQAGRNNIGTDPFVGSRLEMMIGLKQRISGDFGAVANSRRADYTTEGGFPTTHFNFTQPIIDSVTETPAARR